MGKSAATFRARIEFRGGPEAAESSPATYRSHVADLLIHHLPSLGYQVMGVDEHESDLGCSVELANIGDVVVRVDLVDLSQRDMFAAWLRPPLPSAVDLLRQTSTVDLVHDLGAAVASVLQEKGGCHDVRFIDVPPS